MRAKANIPYPPGDERCHTTDGQGNRVELLTPATFG
jgi:hypothetical protein